MCRPNGHQRGGAGRSNPLASGWASPGPPAPTPRARKARPLPGPTGAGHSSPRERLAPPRGSAGAQPGPATGLRAPRVGAWGGAGGRGAPRPPGRRAARLGPWTLVTSPGRVGREGGAPGPPRRLAGSPTGRGAPPPGGARTPAGRPAPARALEAAGGHLSRLRPYHPERARSRLISEAKQGRAWLVLGWETAWEYRVL